ncbi:MAG: hypothetical protein JWP21_1883 [Tardiphaga sp.]|nr:hypothetical protein [Tardiphaga sp.]
MICRLSDAPSLGSQERLDLAPSGRGLALRRFEKFQFLVWDRGVGQLKTGSQLHLSPPGRGRPAQRSEVGRVRGPQASGSVVQINSRTPSRLSYTSVLLTRRTRNPQSSSARGRARSPATSASVLCVTPSTSTTSFPSIVTKSTMYPPISCCLRNFQRSSRRARNACHNLASALVCDRRRFLALALNLSIPLTRISLRSIRPLPSGERYAITGAPS